MIELEYVGNEREEEIRAKLADIFLGQGDLRTDVGVPDETQNRPVQRVSMAVQTGISSDQHSGANRGEICLVMQNRPFSA
jgi:hypothetical protein